MHILIIRPGAIGDTLLTFPIIQAIRSSYASPRITLVGNPAVLPLALAVGLVDETSDYGQLQWSSLFSSTGLHSSAILAQLQHTNLAFCWLRDPAGIVEHNLLLAGVQKVVIAPGRPPDGPQPGKTGHIVAYLAETVGLQHLEMPYKLLFAPLAPAAPIASAEHSLIPPGIQPIAIHPGSGGAHKCWPASSFAALIEHLWQHNYPILLLAGPADHERIHEIQQLLIHKSQLSQSSSTSRPNMLTTLIDAPLLHVARRLQQCKCYIGNDSGITHLSSMLSIPTIALFGPTDPSTWRPVGPYVTVIHEQDLKNVTVETVLKSVLLRLS